MTLIELNNVTFAYDKESDHLALDNLSLTVDMGEWVSIIGPNGSGKSTFAKTLTGLIAPDAGEVIVDGLVLSEEHVWTIRDRVGMVFQNPDNQFVGATVEDDVAFGLENRGIPRPEMIRRVEQSLDAVGMLEFKDREPSTLSGGQKQRVAIAGVLAIEPKIIILDESTSMLDPRGRREVLATIRQVKEEKQLTVLSITHDIDEAALANRLIVLNSGHQVIEGPPKKIFSLGEKLIDCGLDVPFSEILKLRLNELGMTTSDTYQTQEELVEWLWR